MPVVLRDTQDAVWAVDSHVDQTAILWTWTIVFLSPGPIIGSSRFSETDIETHTYGLLRAFSNSNSIVTYCSVG
jgi:hypothetical protein